MYPTTRTVSRPHSATYRRAANSSSPKTLSAAALAQYWSGGFSKYFTPFKRGVIQSPLATISREISE